MKFRKIIAPWPTHRGIRPSARTTYMMSASRAGEGAGSAGLCESWRVWEAGTTSESLNRLLFTPHGTSAAAEPGILEDWICFRDGSWELDEGAIATLTARLHLLGATPAMRIVVGGLVGESGTIDHGLKLGLRRVQSIRTFLLAHGISPGRIGIAVRGSCWLVAEGSGGSKDHPSQGSECRLQVTDPHWTLARN